MKIFKNVGIKIKSNLPIGILALLLVAAALISMNSINSMMDESTIISGNYARGNQLLGNMSTDFQNLQGDVYSHILTTDSEYRTQLEAEMNGLIEEIQQIAEEYETMLDDAEETAAYNQMKEAFTAYVGYLKEAIALSAESKIIKAQKIANAEMLDLGEQISQMVDNMTASNVEGMNEAIATQENVYRSSKTIANIVLMISVVMVVIAVIINTREISHPLVKMEKKISQIVQKIQEKDGDLTERILVDSTDEIGRLGTSINTFIETLQVIMKQISANSEELERVVGNVSTNIETANASSCDVSAVMEELSASMEEITSAVSTVNGDTVEVDNSVTELSDAAQGLLGYAADMKKRAEALEANAVSNKQNTSRVIDDILQNLEKAIADSKSVERVNELTDEILSISSQTNLLALNASIEAARAGEAGRGFAVVADEIRGLADSCRETANNIQNINNMVVIAVKELISGSDSMIKYINDTILPDYDGFVSAGKQYDEDAAHINEIVNNFSLMSVHQKDIVKSITDAMDGISSSIEESANGISQAAISTNDLVKDITDISSEMSINSDIAGILRKESARFTVL